MNILLSIDRGGVLGTRIEAEIKDHEEACAFYYRLRPLLVKLSREISEKENNIKGGCPNENEVIEAPSSLVQKPA